MFYSFFNVIFKNTNPKTPAINEESRIINLALFITVSFSKANKVIKIDIVKPIPPKKPTPNTDFQLISLGNLQIPILTAIKVNKNIPIGFPIIRPSAIPKL